MFLFKFFNCIEHFNFKNGTFKNLQKFKNCNKKSIRHELYTIFEGINNFC